MKKTVERALSAALALALILTLAPAPARAVEVGRGTCGAEGDGSNLTWTLDDAGVLTISGDGAMKNYTWDDMEPWHNLTVKTVVIEEKVTTIGDSAFPGCADLTSVTIPSSVTGIGYSAFSGCKKLTSVTIPSSVTKIANRVFYDCDGLTSVTIPSGVTEIGDELFSECDGLTSVTIPSNVTKIGNKAFSGCGGLTSVTIPSSVTTIGVAAFEHCDALTSVTILEGVTSVGISAFFGCNALTAVSIPRSVSSIGANAFSYFAGSADQNAPLLKLENVYYGGSPDMFKSIEMTKAFSDHVADPANSGVFTVYYVPTLTASAASITPGGANSSLDIVSDTPFRADVSMDDLTVSMTPRAAVQGVSTALSADRKTLTLTFSEAVTAAADLRITVKDSAFSVPVATMEGGVLNTVLPPITANPVQTQPDPGPGTDPGTGGSSGGSGSRPVITPVPKPVPKPAPEPEPEIPGEDAAPPPEQETDSPLQTIVPEDSGVVDWVDRLELPDYAETLYRALSPKGKNAPKYLERDLYFTLPGEQSEEGDSAVDSVEEVMFDLADLFSGGGPSLGLSVFENDDFNRVDAASGDRQIHYESLEPGDAVRTSSFNGVFVTSVPKDGNYDEAKKTACSYISTVFQAFDRDHPEVFWLSGKCKVRIPSAGNTAYFFLVLADDKGFSMRAPAWTAAGSVADGIQRRDRAAASILSGVSGQEDPAETVRVLNRWLTEHNQYNTTPDLNTIGNEPHECLAALEGRWGNDGPVCDGYSRAFKTLCDRLRIPCVLENGYARTSPEDKGSLHMWNMVQISGNWYGVDVTWDDPTVRDSTGPKSGYENERYLLVGAETVDRGMTFAFSHPATNRASADGVAFDNGPKLSTAAFSAVTANAGLEIRLPFTDVREGDWCYEAVDYVYRWNLMQGTAGRTFAPNEFINRRQLWMILARLNGKYPKDMEAARAWAVGEGLTNGENPGGRLTREQLVTMLYRSLDPKSGASSGAALAGFPDAGSVSPYAREALAWAASRGVISGRGDGRLDPQGPATRAQIAVIAQRFRKLDGKG